MPKLKTTGTLKGDVFIPYKGTKIIIGIDPGLQHLGIGILEIDPDICITLESNKLNQIQSHSLLPLIIQHAHLLLSIKQQREITEKLYFIYQTLTKLFHDITPHLVIVEDSFVGINKNSAIKLGLARGSILTAIGQAQAPVLMIPPKQIKMEITQKGDATKEELANFFKKHLNHFTEASKLDTTDALAAAFCGIKHIITP